MIVASDLITSMVSVLDAEGSNRYTFDRDYRPAINYAIRYYASVFNFAFGQKKLSEENLRELTRTRVWQTSKYSRVHFDIADTVEEVWSVLRISPEPTLDPEMDPIVNPDPSSSIFIPDVTFVRSPYSAARQTFEEWNEGERNIFMPGNTVLTNDLKKYAYRNFIHSKPGELAADIIEEVEIRPYLDNQLVGVTYLVYPKQIVADTDVILYPKSMENLLMDKALNFISLKQGDGTTLYTVTEREIATLVKLMS
jgi:hypothetical protein